MIRRAVDLVFGGWELLRLGAQTGFRVRGRYWSWRIKTAFGDSQGLSARERRAAVLEYAVWVHRQRRG